MFTCNRSPKRLLSINNNNRLWLNKIKYLKVTIGRQLEFSTDINNIVSMATQVRGVLPNNQSVESDPGDNTSQHFKTLRHSSLNL